MSEEWKKYGNLVSDICNNDICSEKKLCTKLEINEIVGSKIEREYTNLEKRLIRVNTRLYYTQNKYNLLREENEGFSKLISELFTVFDNNHVDIMFSHIQSIIGYFDLDPHRVCDIILSCSLYQLQYYKGYIELLSKFEKEYVAQILGFKFRQHHPIDSSISPTPNQLYTITAHLIDNKVIQIEQIYNHLYPSEENLIALFNSRKQYVEQHNISLKVISLNKSTGSSTKNDCILSDNQHISLMCSLLRIGDWNDFYKYYKHLNSLHIDLLYDKQFVHALCNYLEYIILPIYEKISLQNRLGNKFEINKKNIVSTQGLPLVYEFKGLFNTIEPIILCLRYMIITNVTAYTYLCRILKHYIVNEPDLFNITENRNMLLKVLGTSLLPSLSLINHNPALSHELWTILDNLKYYERYELYTYWDYLNSTELILEASCKTVENNAAQKLKRLTKDNGSIIGRQISILTHSNPLSVYKVIFRQIEGYENLISVVVDSARCYTYLSYDALCYYFLHQLSKDRNELKNDGENFEDWLCNLSKFAGLLSYKYHFIDLTGVFEYISNMLRKGSIGELLIFNSIIQEMGGVEIMNHNNITQDDLVSSSGGMILMGEKSIYRYSHRPDKIYKKLKSTLSNNNLLSRLFIQLGIERSRVIYNYSDCNPKMLYSLLDTTHLSLTLLSYLCMREKQLYDIFINTINEPFIFKTNYNMDMEVIFHLLRMKMKETYIEKNDKSIWYPFNDEFKNKLKSCLPEKIFDSITIELYITFWIMSLPDLMVPRDKYDKYINELEEKSQHEKDIDKRKEIKSTIEKLHTELDKQIREFSLMEILVRSNKDLYLRDIKEHKESINIFIKYCIKPRILFSYDDAVFSAKFVEKINNIGTPYFSTIQFYYKISGTLLPIIPKLSEREASNLGLFLCELWTKLEEWRKDKNKYLQECQSNPGFLKKYRQLDSEKYTHEDYLRIYRQIHKTQADIFIDNLKNPQYTYIRNTLIVLQKMRSIFPMIKNEYDNIIDTVQKITDKEGQYDDLKILASSYTAQLKRVDSRMYIYKQKAAPNKPIEKRKETVQPIQPPPPPVTPVTPRKEIPIPEKKKDTPIIEKKKDTPTTPTPEKTNEQTQKKDPIQSEKKKDTNLPPIKEDEQKRNSLPQDLKRKDNPNTENPPPKKLRQDIKKRDNDNQRKIQDKRSNSRGNGREEGEISENRSYKRDRDYGRNKRKY